MIRPGRCRDTIRAVKGSAGRDLWRMALPGGWPVRPTTLRLDLAGQRFVPDLRERIDTARPYLEVEVFDALTDISA